MKLKDKRFHPKKVNTKHSKVRDDEKKLAEKKPHGTRFGNRWFPYDK